MKIESFRTIFIYFLLFNTVSAFAKPLKSDTIIIDATFKEQDLSGFVDIYTSDKLLPINIIWDKINRNDLKQIPSDNFFPGMGDKFYWLVIKLKNSAETSRDMVIEVNNPQIDSIYFYELKKNNSIIFLSESGDEIPFDRRITVSELPTFSINLNIGDEKTFILMLRKRKIIKFPSKIYDKHIFEQHSRKKLFVYSFYFGGVFLIFITTLIIGLFIHNKTLVTYAFYIIAMGAYLFTETGFAYEFVYPELVWLNSPMRVPISLVAIVLFFIFSNLFIETKKYNKIIPKLFNIIYVLWVATYLFSLPFVNIYPDAYHSFILIAHYAFILFSMALMLFTVIFIFRFNKKTALTYLFAISIFIMGIVVYYVPQFGLIKTGITSYHPMLFASIGEFFVFSFALFFNIQKVNIEKNKLLEITALQEKEILTAQIKGNEQASKRISGELHDNISSRLALLKNKILNKHNAKNELVNDVVNLYKEVRDISHRLSPNNFFMLGCSNAVKEYLQEINDNTALNINTKLYCNAKDKLNNEIGFQVFRIIQELTQNCIKYAGIADVIVQIMIHEKELSLIVEDNGKGFNMDDKLLMSGNGIQNIRMRVELLNGTFDISSKLGEGTYISISIPL